MPKKLSKQQFIERAKQIHGDKYDYSKVEYINYEAKVCIICPVHGEFWQRPHDHLDGHGCPFCVKTHKMDKQQFIERAKQIHGNKYDYSKIEYLNIKTAVCIICPVHGEFWQKPLNHLDGCGCQICAGKIKATTTSFIERAKQIHGDKYDYSKVKYIDTKTKVCISCLEHGDFWQTPDDHLRGHGCPFCKESKGERAIRNFLAEHNINYEEQKRFADCRNKRTLPFDFYLPEYNLCIEYQGKQHFLESSLYTNKNKLQVQQNNDNIKRKWCLQDANPNLLEIKYTDFDNINNILIKNLI